NKTLAGMNIQAPDQSWSAKIVRDLTRKECGSIVYTGISGQDSRNLTIVLSDHRTRTCEDIRLGQWEVVVTEHGSRGDVSTLHAYAEIVEGKEIGDAVPVPPKVIACQVTYRCPKCFDFFNVYKDASAQYYVETSASRGETNSTSGLEKVERT